MRTFILVCCSAPAAADTMPRQIFSLAGLCAAVCFARAAVLSNTALPLDTDGNLMLTGESSVLAVNGTFYLYANVWGGCPGVDCCSSPTGCASCCFQGPTDPCVYTDNHTVVAYSTRDFAAWRFEGVMLAPSGRRAGIEFRPQVVYAAQTGLFVMWYEDRWSSKDSNKGYAVATGPSPVGPFTTVSNSTPVPGAGRIGDYDIFVDPDTSVGFHVRTGVTIVQLSADLTAAAVPARVYEMPDGSVEGPAMFKRNGVFYLLFGKGCCACRGGSNIDVYTASSALGPYTFRGDVGSNASQAFDAHSPYNYNTHAQQTKVFTVTAADGSEQFVWLGNQWVTSALPGRPRAHDLLFWAVLEFDDAGMIKEVQWQDSATITVP
jgi:hypothetical protein